MDWLRSRYLAHGPRAFLKGFGHDLLFVIEYVVDTFKIVSIAKIVYAIGRVAFYTGLAAGLGSFAMAWAFHGIFGLRQGFGAVVGAVIGAIVGFISGIVIIDADDEEREQRAKEAEKEEREARRKQREGRSWQKP